VRLKHCKQYKEGLVVKADLGYSINDEQIEEKRLAQAPQGGEKSYGKAPCGS
jgi:hypothetical protein